MSGVLLLFLWTPETALSPNRSLWIPPPSTPARPQLAGKAGQTGLLLDLDCGRCTASKGLPVNLQGSATLAAQHSCCHSPEKPESGSGEDRAN